MDRKQKQEVITAITLSRLVQCVLFAFSAATCIPKGDYIKRGSVPRASTEPLSSDAL